MSLSTKCLLATALLIGAMPGRPALAGPPFVTDDPEPVEFKHWEFYTFSIYSHTAGVDSGQFPAIEFNYGVLPDFHLHVIAPLAYDREPGGNPQYGYGDTELGLKYRFFHETDHLPQIGVFPLVEVPTGDSGRGLGNGQTQIFAPIWFQKTWGKDKEWTSFWGGGFWYNPGRGLRNYMRFGWELQRDFGEHLTLGGEVFHETPSAAVGAIAGTGAAQTSAGEIGVQGHTAFNLGLYYNIDDHRHLLFSAGRDIDGPNRFMTYLAYQLTF